MRFIKGLIIYDNFKIKNRIKTLSKSKLADLKKMKIMTFISIYILENVSSSFMMQKIENKFKRFRSQQTNKQKKK